MWSVSLGAPPFAERGRVPRRRRTLQLWRALLRTDPRVGPLLVDVKKSGASCLGLERRGYGSHEGFKDVVGDAHDRASVDIDAIRFDFERSWRVR
jgi:hypothetical protein